MSEESVQNNDPAPAEEAPQPIDPLDLGWRYALRWRPLMWQAAGCAAVLLAIALTMCVVINLGPKPPSGWAELLDYSQSGPTVAQILVGALAKVFLSILCMLTSATVMAVAAAEGSGDTEFRVFPFLRRSIAPTAVVGGGCMILLLGVSVVCHFIPSLLATTDNALGKVIFALAMLPMYFVAFLQVAVALVALFVFTPMLADGPMTISQALKRFLDAIIGCRSHDICLRVRAFVNALLLAVPIIVVLSMCDAIVFGTALIVRVPVFDLFHHDFVGLLMLLSTIAITALASAAPMSYFNTVCLLVHRSARD